MNDGIHNATVKTTKLGREHSAMTAWLMFDYGGGGHQGFGGYSLDDVPEKKESGYDRRPHAACGLFISRVLSVLKRGRWEDLPGTPCRVRTEDGLVRAIGNYLEDDWFVPGEELVNLDPNQ